MRGLAVASPLHPAAAAARRRPHASSSGREAASQCWKYDLSQDRSLGGSLRICQSQGNLQRHRSTNLFRPAAAAISVEQDEINTYLPKGDMWSVHKFGGTCMGTPQRIQSVADIILGDSSERKLVIVSAMSKVTDMMYNLVHKAQSRDDSYTIALEEVFEKHMAAAKDLLDGEDLARFLSQLHSDVSNLRAMLRAIYIAGHATESFSDFVVGHGELWSAQMLFFFESKAGALPIHLRRSNCTSRAEANTTTHKQRTRTTHTTRHYTTAIWEKSQSKPSQPAPSSPTLCHSQSHNPLQAQEAT